MNHIRHSGIFDASELAVTLIGAGGIGAITAVTLAKMGVAAMVIFDDDVVSEENLPTQLHAVSDLGNPKVHAVHALVHIFSDKIDLDIRRVRVAPWMDPEDITMMGADVIISAVDSITARQQIWETIKQVPYWRYYIDASMGAEVFSAYVVPSNNADVVKSYGDAIERLEESDIPDDPCTAKATFYTAAIAAGHLGHLVKLIANGEDVPALVQHRIKDQNLIALGLG